MKPYSKDLRERIIVSLEAEEETQPEIAERFGVSLSFVEKLWGRWRKTGSYEALAQGNGPQRRLEEYADVIRTEVAIAPDATLKELCERVERAVGVKSSPSRMCRELQILKLDRKKVTLRQRKRYTESKRIKSRVL